MKNKELFFISLTVFLTIITWIIADIYHIINTEKVKINEHTNVQPISTKIDIKVFDNLEKKK